MSVLWELDAHSLAVNKVWYGRTLIRSSYQLHYELAQALLNGEQAEVPELAQLGSEEKDAKLAELTQALDMLTHVARHLRAQRDRGGALELEGVEVIFLFVTLFSFHFCLITVFEILAVLDQSVLMGSFYVLYCKW